MCLVFIFLAIVRGAADVSVLVVVAAVAVAAALSVAVLVASMTATASFVRVATHVPKCLSFEGDAQKEVAALKRMEAVRA